MAKIRGIKPDFWTDEKIVSLNISTRLFFIGIWNFCDDCGVFEWKPLELKMKIFPADNLDTKKALQELVRKKCIQKFDKDGKVYAVILNFQKHQRPDKRFLTFLFADEQAFISGLVVDTASSPRDHHDEGEGEGEGEGEVEGEVDITTNVVMEQAPRPDKRNPDINKMLEALKRKIGVDDFADSQRWARIYAKHCLSLMDSLGQNEFSRRLDIILNDSFKRKNCNKIKYVYGQIKGFIESKPNVVTIET